MAVKIRLKRMGAKKNPYYRVIVIDDSAKRDGKAIEEIGFYKPVGEKAVEIDADSAKKWLSAGAQPTDTVKALLKKQGIIK